MPGPMPKNPSIRQRRNKATTRAMLPAETGQRKYRPRLPKLGKNAKWHPLAREYWDLVWTSPMSHLFLEADIPVLFRLLILVNRFFEGGSLKVAAEIRMLEREFGLTPLSRRRLEWTVAQAEEATDRHEQRRSRRAVIINADPRGVLDG
jgi:hypothetical protein